MQLAGDPESVQRHLERLAIDGTDDERVVQAVVDALETHPSAALRAWTAIRIAPSLAVIERLVGRLGRTGSDRAMRLVLLLAVARAGPAAASIIDRVEPFLKRAPQGPVGYGAVFTLLSLDPSHGRAVDALLDPWLTSRSEMHAWSGLFFWTHLRALSDEAFERLERYVRQEPSRILCGLLSRIAHTHPARALSIARDALRGHVALHDAAMLVVAGAHRGAPTEESARLLSETCVAWVRRGAAYELTNLGFLMENWMRTGAEMAVIDAATELAYAAYPENPGPAQALLTSLIRGLRYVPSETKLHAMLRAALGDGACEMLPRIPEWPDPLEAIHGSWPIASGWSPPPSQKWTPSPFSIAAEVVLNTAY